MDKNFGLKVLAIAGISCLCLTGCFNSKDITIDDNVNVIIPVVEDTVVEGDVKIKIDTVLARLKISDLNKLSNEDAAKLYGLEKIEDYDVGVYVKSTEKDYEEITVIKMSDKSEAEDILMKVSARIAKLHQEYSDNSEILSILQNTENVIIKQEGDIQTIIISKDAKAVEAKLKVQF